MRSTARHDHLRLAGRAIIHHESRGWPVGPASSIGVTSQGVPSSRAGNAPRRLRRPREGRGAVLVGAAGIATAVAQAAPAIQALGTLAPAVAIAVIVAAVVGVLAWRLRRPA